MKKSYYIWYFITLIFLIRRIIKVDIKIKYNKHLEIEGIQLNYAVRLERGLQNCGFTMFFFGRGLGFLQDSHVQFAVFIWNAGLLTRSP
jgi:hypothetical protein